METHRGCEDFPCWAVSQPGPPEPGRSPRWVEWQGALASFASLEGEKYKVQGLIQNRVVGGSQARAFTFQRHE